MKRENEAKEKEDEELGRPEGAKSRDDECRSFQPILSLYSSSQIWPSDSDH